MIFLKIKHWIIMFKKFIEILIYSKINIKFIFIHAVITIAYLCIYLGFQNHIFSTLECQNTIFPRKYINY